MERLVWEADFKERDVKKVEKIDSKIVLIQINFLPVTLCNHCFCYFQESSDVGT